MKRFLAVAMFVGTLSVAPRVHAEDKPSAEPKHCPTAPPASHSSAQLFDAAKTKIGLIKDEAAATLSRSERAECLLLAADLAELAELDNEAKRCAMRPRTATLRPESSSC